MDTLRTHRGGIDIEECPPIPAPETDPAAEGLWSEIWSGTHERLSPKEVQVIEGLLIDKTTEEMARELGLTRNPVYQEKHRAFQKPRDTAERLRGEAHRRNRR